jgi:hypothetical protein
MTATNPTNPWGEPPVAPELVAVKPTYFALMRTLHALSLADEELPAIEPSSRSRSWPAS